MNAVLYGHATGCWLAAGIFFLAGRYDPAIAVALVGILALNLRLRCATTESHEEESE